MFLGVITLNTISIMAITEIMEQNITPYPVKKENVPSMNIIEVINITIFLDCKNSLIKCFNIIFRNKFYHKRLLIHKLI